MTNPINFMWHPITDFTPAQLAVLGMVLIKRIWGNYESYPRVAAFVKHAAPSNITPKSKTAQCGYWESETGKAVCFQSVNLSQGWATHIMILDRPADEWIEKRHMHGYVNYGVNDT